MRGVFGKAVGATTATASTELRQVRGQIIAGPGLGDAGGVAPVTIGEATAVGKTMTHDRVLSFTEKRLLTEFKIQDWKRRETQ
jgi:hypothetical protein